MVLHLRRRPDWATRLHAALDRRRPVAHGWDGNSDCLVAVADCVEATTGTDILADVRGSWSSRETAERALAESGYADLAAALDARLPRIHPSRARMGDIGLIPGEAPFGWTPGIISAGRLFVQGPTCGGHVSFSLVQIAYVVG